MDLSTSAGGRERSATGERSGMPIAHALTKVPEIGAMFWVLKLLTTGMGEAMSDFLGQQSVPAAALIGIVGIGYGVPTPFFAIVTAAIFYAWYRREGTLSIHSITTPRRERFYWAAVLATFALGTAAGDLTAIALKLGFFPSVWLFAAIIAVPAVGYWRLRLNPILAFWGAYIVTRPLGASFADWFSKPTNGGLNLGDGLVAAVELVVFIGLVAYVARTKLDVQPARVHHHRHPHPIPTLAAEPE